jgi:hypothetical protein
MQHGIWRSGGDSLHFEWTSHDVHPAPDDPEKKRIQNRDRELVAHRRRVFGLAMNNKSVTAVEAKRASLPRAKRNVTLRKMRRGPLGSISGPRALQQVSGVERELGRGG